MKVMKSFTSVWNVSKNLYFNIGTVGFKVSFTFAGFCVLTLIFMMSVGKYIPLFYFDNPLVRYFVIPLLVAYLMDRKTLDDKKPISFLTTQIKYFCRPRITYAGQKVEYKKKKENMQITLVETERGGKSV